MPPRGFGCAERSSARGARRGLAALLCCAGRAAGGGCVDSRPPPSQRTFVSELVEQEVDSLASSIHDATLACIFRNALPNCLDTTVYLFAPANESLAGGPASGAGRGATCGRAGGAPEDDAFVVTGDIPAMWLRDSTNQVLPYMRFAARDGRLRAMLGGLLRRQARQIRTDAYANAHNADALAGASPNGQDVTTKPSYLGTRVSAMSPMIFERKYELDSLCAFLKLGAEYYAATGDAAPFDSSWAQSVSIVLATMRSQQKSTEDDEGIYSFQRCNSCSPRDTLEGGTGPPARRTGMVRSAFRPSDDATTLQFLVPANAMAVVELRRAAEVARRARGDHALGQELEDLAAEIDDGIRREAIVVHRRTGEAVYAYEVDGFGNAFHMDDANVPSLLSLPYLGFVPVNDSTYQSTRRVVLSAATNPFYFDGAAGRGVGSPHTGPGQIWPMSVIMQALTSQDDGEIRACLSVLNSTTASRWFMHESFGKDDATSFTRPWFSWANSLFGQLIFHLAENRPHLLLRQRTEAESVV